MSTRKYDISHMTEEDLTVVAEKYPAAVRSIRRPVYRIIAMLLECGLDVPGVRVKENAIAAQNKAAAASALPEMLKRSHKADVVEKA